MNFLVSLLKAIISAFQKKPVPPSVPISQPAPDVRPTETVSPAGPIKQPQPVQAPTSRPEPPDEAVTFREALRLILRFEGGYVFNKSDPGGATNMGVTQTVYNEYQASQGAANA